MEQPQFQNWLILTYGIDGKPSFIKTPKVQALQPYIGKKGNINKELELGYEPLY